MHVYALDNNNGEGWMVSVVGRAHGTRDLRAVDVPPDIPWSIRGGGDLIELAAEIVHGERVAMVADDEDE